MSWFVNSGLLGWVLLVHPLVVIDVSAVKYLLPSDDSFVRPG